MSMVPRVESINKQAFENQRKGCRKRTMTTAGRPSQGDFLATCKMTSRIISCATCTSQTPGFKLLSHHYIRVLQVCCIPGCQWVSQMSHAKVHACWKERITALPCFLSYPEPLVYQPLKAHLLIYPQLLSVHLFAYQPSAICLFINPQGIWPSVEYESASFAASQISVLAVVALWQQLLQDWPPWEGVWSICTVASASLHRSSSVGGQYTGCILLSKSQFQIKPAMQLNCTVQLWGSCCTRCTTWQCKETPVQVLVRVSLMYG